MEELINELNENLKNITKKELKEIITKLKNQEVDYDKVDWYALGYDANRDMIESFIFQEYGVELQKESQNKTQNETKNIFKDEMGFWSEVVKEVKSVGIIGETGTGKTALAHRILGMVRKHTKRDIYLLNYPKPELIKKLGWKNLHNLEQLRDLRDVCVYLDEPQELMRFYTNNGNPALTRLLALARQRNIMLIFSTSISQYFVRSLEGQIEVWCIKDTDVDTVKQGSRASKIIKRYCMFDTDGFRLEKDEYLFYCRKFYERYNGKFNFTLPKYWNDEFSKPYG